MEKLRGAILRGCVRKITVNPILGQVKILVFSKEYTEESVPQSCSPPEDATQVKPITH